MLSCARAQVVTKRQYLTTWEWEQAGDSVRATLSVSHLQSQACAWTLHTQNGQPVDREEIFAELDKKCIGLELQTQIKVVLIIFCGHKRVMRAKLVAGHKTKRSGWKTGSADTSDLSLGFTVGATPLTLHGVLWSTVTGKMKISISATLRPCLVQLLLAEKQAVAQYFTWATHFYVSQPF